MVTICEQLSCTASTPVVGFMHTLIEVKQVFLLYLWDSLVTLELISLIPLVGPLTDPLAVKLLHNRLYIPHSKYKHKLWYQMAFIKQLQCSRSRTSSLYNISRYGELKLTRLVLGLEGIGECECDDLRRTSKSSQSL